MRLLLLAPLLLLVGSAMAQEKSTVVELTIFRDADNLIIFVEKQGNVSLEGLRLSEASLPAPLELASLPAFESLFFDNIPTPICFRLQRNGTSTPLVLQCTGSVPTLTQNLIGSNVFWYDNSDNTDRTFLVLSDEVTMGICPAGQDQCHITFGAGGVLPPTPSPVPITPTTVPPTPVGGGSGEIAFVSDRDGNLEIYVMAVDGSTVRRLTNDPANDLNPAWSPDGQFLAFESDRGFDAFVPLILTMNADGSNLREVTDGRDPVWSPDGQQIAFMAPSVDSGAGGLRESIFVINLGGTGLRQVTADEIETSPDWSPDGRQFVIGTQRSGFELFIADAASGEKRQLTSGGGFEGGSNPVWSPSGDRIAFDSSRSGSRDIFLINPDGSNEQIITSNPASDFDPAWSPDGQHIVFVSDRDGNNELYIMNADGSNQRRITDTPADEFAPAWRP